MRLAATLGFLGFLAAQAVASERIESGPNRATLIELFTSEGCSSCPPADKWLGDLRTNPALWKTLVPLEFHVNYWDNLGWKDRLSTPEFTAREYAYANAWGSSPYTPCFVRNGSQWRPAWGSAEGPGAPVGVLSVNLGDDGVCSVDYRRGPAAREGIYVVHVAILGGGISSNVTRGENSGRTLEHEFVVLGVADQVLTSPERPAAMYASLPLPHPIATGSVRRAFAAWVTLQGEMEPIQAVGGWLPPAQP